MEVSLANLLSHVMFLYISMVVTSTPPHLFIFSMNFIYNFKKQVALPCIVNQTTMLFTRAYA